jgi:cation diffusion facilitator family transporter
MRATVVAVLASVVLAAVKIFTGLVGNSYALVADGIESILDIFGSLLVLGGLRLSVVPQTDRFPYGLGKAEPLGALVVATVLIIAAAGISVQAVHEIVVPHTAPAPFTLVVLVAVVVTKELLFRTLSARAKVIGSHGLATDAWHHRSDALTSLAAFVGISTALLLGEGYESADDWAALVACGVIAFNGSRLIRGALVEILDVAAPSNVECELRRVAAEVPGVVGIDVCRIRRSGLAYLVDIHVEVDGSLSVRHGHRLAHDVKDALLTSSIPVLDVLVHIEPAPD